MSPILTRLFLLFIATLILSIMPLPDILQGFRLPWVCLLFLYIQFFLPQYFYISLLLIMGCFLDVLLATVIGEHAFALLLVSWMANTKARRMQFFTMGQQMIMFGIFCLIYQSVIIGIDAFLGFHYIGWMPLVSGVAAMFFWPWIKILLDTVFMPRFVKRY